MTNSLRSSHVSETCRLEWRPSRLLRGLLIALGVLGALATLASGVPPAAGWLVAAASTLAGWRAAARERARPARCVVWNGHARIVRVDGVAVAEPRLAWRGALACLSWRDAGGRVQRLQFWPDVLDARGRRELRLAAGPMAASPRNASMAP